jgi:hypothetical protein
LDVSKKYVKIRAFFTPNITYLERKEIVAAFYVKSSLTLHEQSSASAWILHLEKKHY